MIKNRLLSVLAGNSNLAIMIATPQNKKQALKQIEVRAHVCPNCEIVATINNMDSPSCPVCSSNMVPLETASSLEVSASELKGFPVIASCNSCECDIHGDEKLKVIAGNADMHCPVCGDNLKVLAVEKDSDSEEDSDDPDSEEEYYKKHPNVMLEKDEEDSSKEDDSLEEASDEEDDSEDDSEDEDYPEDDSEDEDYSEEEASDEDDYSEEDSEDDFEPVKDEDDINEEDEDSEKVEEASSKEIKTEQASVTVSALRHAINSDAEIELVASSLENGSTRWHLFGNGAHIASANKEDASEAVAAIFNDRKLFQESFVASIADGEGATEETLNNFGFKSDKIDIPVDIATKTHIDNEVAAKTAAFNVEKEVIADRFSKCLSTSALGIRKGIFGIESPLRKAIIASFEENGVRGAHAITDKIFNETAADELKLILSRTNELVVKTDEALAEVSSMVESSAFKVEASVIENKPAASFVSVSQDAPLLNRGSATKKSDTALAARALYGSSRKRF